jgi:DNA-binding NarL/FixJ family response regulator
VVIADDHAATAEVVAAALEAGGFDVCAIEHDGPSAVRAARELAPDIALLDIHMPGNGIRAAQQISASEHPPAVVMLTVSEQDEDLFGALRAGAVGYLLKGMDPNRLPDALRSVLAGEAALPRSLVGRLVGEFREREGATAAAVDGRGWQLTAREWEVLELLEQGLSTAEIADRLFIGKVTVRTHCAAIVRKLHVRDRDAAARMYRDERGSGA